MANLAAHAGAFHAASTDTTGEVSGLDNIDWGPAADVLEITDFADTSAAKKRMLGLKDVTCTVSGHYDSANSPQELIRTSWTSGADLYIRWLPNGSAGFKVVVKVSEFKVSAGVGETVKFSATLLGNGAIAAV